MDDKPRLESGMSRKEYLRVALAQSELGRKFEGTDLFYHDDREFLVDTAWEYAETYTGNFQFMLDMRKNYQKNETLSEKMSAGVLNCMAAEWRRVQTAEIEAAAQKNRNAQRGETVVSEANEFKIPEGRYTIVRADGDYHTIWIKDLDEEHLARYEKPEGTRIIKYLNGPDNGRDYMAFGWVNPQGQLAVWGRFRENSELVEDATNLLSMDRNGVLKTTEAYALKSGRCSQCGRELTVEESIVAGMGPVCAGRFGL